MQLFNKVGKVVEEEKQNQETLITRGLIPKGSHHLIEINIWKSENEPG